MTQLYPRVHNKRHVIGLAEKVKLSQEPKVVSLKFFHLQIRLYVRLSLVQARFK